MSSRESKAVIAQSLATGSCAKRLELEQRWISASKEQKEVLSRIALQRDRIASRNAAYAQAQSLKQKSEVVSPDAPLVERISTFVRLHPIASLACLGIALMVGPRKILKAGIAIWPVASKFMR